MMTILIERKKEFIRVIYIRNFKNNLSKIYTCFALLVQSPKNPETEEITLPILKRNLPILIKTYDDNLGIIVKKLREYKDLRQEKEFIIISQIWTVILPTIYKDLSKLLSHIAQNKIDDVFYSLVKKNYEHIYNLPKLFNELQENLFGKNGFSFAERKQLDGM